MGAVPPRPSPFHGGGSYRSSAPPCATGEGGTRTAGGWGPRYSAKRSQSASPASMAKPTERPSCHPTHLRAGGRHRAHRPRPAEKRNAINDALVEALREAVERASAEAKVAVIFGHGDHFSAGLDLAEHAERTPIEGIHHSRKWHAIFDRIERGAIPFLSAIHGAAVGGGMELAAATQIASPKRARSSPSPRVSAASSSAAAARCGSRASSPPRGWPT